MFSKKTVDLQCVIKSSQVLGYVWIDEIECNHNRIYYLDGWK